MNESAYRESVESRRSLLESLRAQAAALGARLDRTLLGRVDKRELRRIDAKWVAAGEAARGAETMEALTRACEAHRLLIGLLESVEAREHHYRFLDMQVRSSDALRLKVQVACAAIAFALLGVTWMSVAFAHGGSAPSGALLLALIILQIVFGLAALIMTFTIREGGARAGVVGVFGFFVALAAPLITFAMALGAALGGLGGGAWGRPLRLRGRVLHPELREGADWTRGARPDARDLDAPTRAALEALWLHDAQKEHASVPALARVTWLLAAVGAPADLVEAVQVAALEEIEHARLCFALAAGYGGRSHTVEPMPELVAGGIDVGGDPLVRIAVESLNDGCLLEDFNADIADLCAAACREEATRAVLVRIAREERSHAELSWRLLAFALDRGGERVERAVERAIRAMDRVARPTATSRAAAALVARADAAAMRAHGRIADAEWGDAWRARLDATKRRAEALALPSLPAITAA